MWYIGTSKSILTILTFYFPQVWALISQKKNEQVLQLVDPNAMDFFIILQIKPSVA